jgi:hypothetical protein
MILALWVISYHHRKLDTMTTAQAPTLIVFRNGTPIFTSHGNWLHPLFELEEYLADHAWHCQVVDPPSQPVT